MKKNETKTHNRNWIAYINHINSRIESVYEYNAIGKENCKNVSDGK